MSTVYYIQNKYFVKPHKLHPKLRVGLESQSKPGVKGFQGNERQPLTRPLGNDKMNVQLRDAGLSMSKESAWLFSKSLNLRQTEVN